MSLHRALSIFVVVVAILALGGAVSLILLTTYLHRATLDLESGLHGARLAEEMQIDLRLYNRTEGKAERDSIENDLHQKLEAARKYVDTAAEQRALAEAAYFLDRYFEAARDGKSEGDEALHDAFVGLRGFIDINTEQANASLTDSARLDALGDRIGIIVAAGLVIGTAIILIWLHRIAFRPVFEIRDALKGFAAGRKEVRVTVHGPEEFIGIADQFNEMADALTRQHHNQAAFLASIAHDLRNPISALKMSAEILSGPAVPPDRINRLMGVIKRQVSNIDRMISDLLDSAKIESGKLDLRFEELDGRIVAEDAFNLFRSASKSHELTLRIPEYPVPLYCDRVRIEQVLNNLLSNAIKYSPGGGQVEVSLREADNEGLFQVSDQGIGIRHEDVQYIFEPFRRVRTPQEDIPGTGLGLSVVQRIVQAHGGRIEVTSEIGKGTTFDVHIPKAA